MESQQSRERVKGIPDEVLGQAIIKVAAGHNPDLEKRVKEVMDEGGDGLTFLGSCVGGAGRDALELARRLRLKEQPPKIIR